MPTVKGIVLSGSDNTPVSNAKVYVEKTAFNAFEPMLTKSDGSFLIPGMKVSDYKDLKQQRSISYQLYIEKEGYQMSTVNVKAYSSVNDTIDQGLVELTALTTTNIIGNVYILDTLSRNTNYEQQVQAIRIDEIHEDTLRVKYKFGQEMFLDADFIWRESIGAYFSSKPLTYGSHSQFKSGARIVQKQNALDLQFEGKQEKLSFLKLYNKPVDLKTHRDPYFAEDGFSTEKPFEVLINEMVRSSNATALKNYQDAQVRISDIGAKKISIELYVTNSNSEDHSIGWLEYYPYEDKLQDITNDAESPEILDFDINILKTVNFEHVFGYKHE